MTWVAVATAGAGLLGSFMNKKSGDSAAKNSEAMAKADREFQERMYNQSLQDNRSNQTTDWGKLTWAQDPTTKKWTQENKLAAPEAARLEDFRQIAADRMGAAKGGYKADWNSIGFGHLAKAAGIGQGDTGEAPWMKQKYSSSANDFLRNGQAPGYHPGGANAIPPAYGPTTSQPAGPPAAPPQHAEISPGYQAGQQFAPPPAAPAPAAAAPAVDPNLQAQADALRRQQEEQQQMQWASNSSNGSG